MQTILSIYSEIHFYYPYDFNYFYYKYIFFSARINEIVVNYVCLKVYYFFRCTIMIQFPKLFKMYTFVFFIIFITNRRQLDKFNKLSFLNNYSKHETITTYDKIESMSQ